MEMNPASWGGERSDVPARAPPSDLRFERDGPHPHPPDGGDGSPVAPGAPAACPAPLCVWKVLEPGCHVPGASLSAAP